MKIIHFFKDCKDLDTDRYVGWYNNFISHNETMNSLKRGDKLICTTALSVLNFSYLLDRGYKIFLHENGKMGEIHEGVTKLTDKEIRKEHNIREIWIGGGFKEYFYD